MTNQLLLIELKDAKFFYDIMGESFMPHENINLKIPFSELKYNKEQLLQMGYSDDLAKIKFITAHLMIQSHVLFGLAPKPAEFEFLKSVFPCIPNPFVIASSN